VAGQRRGLFVGFIDLLARVGIRLSWVEDKRDSLRDVDAALTEFYRERRAKIPAVVGL
jgi:hypothetical protein